MAILQVLIQYQDRFQRWQPYQVIHSEGLAITMARFRARITGRPFRIVDASGRQLHLVHP